ncbi:hemerythrin domain-containing protein [Elioraea rosea]|uniref:hemerythrin domain-containing protein n=1 Tax=Elioraea rosea TaxID=2492390 RepID=UPI001183E390|nr:hemerythrin domain-containing protein [Elioraea rosea]
MSDASLHHHSPGCGCNTRTAATADDGEISPLPEETGALIEHVLARYHAAHRRELPELIALARRVERVHADVDDAPLGLATLLEAIAQDLTDHMAKEEAVLFPMMRRGGHAIIDGPIAVMRHEHAGHGEALRALAQLTNGHVPPDGACGSWRALYAGTRKLAEDLETHMHIENDILFPRFRT